MSNGSGIAAALGVGVGLVALGALGRAAGTATSSGGGSGGGAQEFPEGLSPLRSVAADVLTAGGSIDPGWITFLGAVAHHESGWDPAVYNGFADAQVPTGVRRVGKVDGPGAVSNYNRNAKHYANCTWPKARYTFGSGGWYGFLPTVGLHAFIKGPYVCLDPWSVFSPYPSTIMAIDMARRLKNNWAGFKKQPTWKNLNRGWKAPGNMGSPQEGSDRRFDRALRAMGVPVEWGDQEVAGLGGWKSGTANHVLGLWLGNGDANA